MVASPPLISLSLDALPLPVRIFPPFTPRSTSPAQRVTDFFVSLVDCWPLLPSVILAEKQRSAVWCDGAIFSRSPDNSSKSTRARERCRAADAVGADLSAVAGEDRRVQKRRSSRFVPLPPSLSPLLCTSLSTIALSRTQLTKPLSWQRSWSLGSASKKVSSLSSSPLLPPVTLFPIFPLNADLNPTTASPQSKRISTPPGLTCPLSLDVAWPFS